MNRRRIIITTIAGSVTLGLAALVGLAGYYAIPRVEDEDEADQQAENRR